MLFPKAMKMSMIAHKINPSITKNAVLLAINPIISTFIAISVKCVIPIQNSIFLIENANSFPQKMSTTTTWSA